MTVYRDVKDAPEDDASKKSDKDKKERSVTPTNGGVEIARESLAIIRDSQNLVLLDIPHKLDEVIDELHDTRTQIAQLVKTIETLTQKITRHYDNTKSNGGC